jgi:hypothetical protein
MNTTEISDRVLDSIYDYADSLIRNEEWEYLSSIFHGFLLQVDILPLDVKLAFLTATLPAKSHIKNRKEFLIACQSYDPSDNLWNGL